MPKPSPTRQRPGKSQCTCLSNTWAPAGRNPILREDRNLASYLPGPSPVAFAGSDRGCSLFLRPADEIPLRPAILPNRGQTGTPADLASLLPSRLTTGVDPMASREAPKPGALRGTSVIDFIITEACLSPLEKRKSGRIGATPYCRGAYPEDLSFPICHLSFAI